MCRKVREKIRKKIEDHCCKKKIKLPDGPHSDDWQLNSLTLLQNAGILLRDIFSFIGLADTAHSTGSFNLQVTVCNIDCDERSAEVSFAAADALTLYSATRIPKKNHSVSQKFGIPNDPLGSQNAPFNNIYLDWNWAETVK